MTETPTRIYVDADACPVKDEIYRPRSFSPRDRSSFLSALDQTLRRIQRRRADQAATSQG